MIPAQRTFLVLSFAALLLAVGALAPIMRWIALLLDLLVLSAMGVDWYRGRAIDVRAEREWPEILIQQVASELGLTVWAERHDRAPSRAGRDDHDDRRGTVKNVPTERITVQLRETLHPSLARLPYRQRLTLKGLGRHRLCHSIVPQERGEHTAGPLVARVLGPWQLAWSQRALLPAEPVRVYPRIRWGGRVGQLLSLAQRNQLGAVTLDRSGVGGELYALRPYLSGDSRNRIHWKATARRGHLVTREDAWERGAPMIILLDCGRTMITKSEGTTRSEGLSKLDHALAAALVLTRVGLGRGDRVSLLAVSDRIERQVHTRPGKSGIGVVYQKLYDLLPRRVETLFDLASETVLKMALPRSTVVVFTSISDLAAAELLLDALRRLRRRHRPMLINLEDPTLRHLAEQAPADEPEVYAKLSALEILLRNRALTRQLQRAGIAAVTASADRLALETLEGYFDLLGGLFRGGRSRASGRSLVA